MCRSGGWSLRGDEILVEIVGVGLCVEVEEEIEVGIRRRGSWLEVEGGVGG